MTITTVARLSEHDGQTVTLRGWLQNRRSKGKIAFLQVRDGSGTVQCIAVAAQLDEESFKALSSLPYESALTVTGAVRADSRAPGGYELEVVSAEIISVAEEYPIANQAHGADFLLSHRHLWLRSSKQVAIMRIRDEVIRAIRDFFHERDFINVDAPIFTPNACEGTTTLFEVEYSDDERAFLSQSGQLYNEAAAMAYGRVYCFGPTFRAERSKTRRHLREFWMCEPEMAYADLDDVMDLAEGLLCFIAQRVLTHRKRELEVLERDVSRLEAIQKPFPRLSYEEAAKKMAEGGHDFRFGEDFGAPDETFVSNLYDRPVMVHRYPHEVKAFYMKRDPADDRFALGVDVLAPEGYGEVIGGGQREEDLEVLRSRIRAHELPQEAFEWYLDLRRYGSVPHGGFGLGLERTVAWMCGIEHIREAIPFPRMLYRIYP
ncbi:MAG: asparagine--tRNA ligase [Planctomycetes bacterium]|nr:asparagine--tRNA ligase [Planctomycetota bacterium]